MNQSRPRPRVLYYAHDHGSGHVRHAARAAATGAFDLTVVTASATADRVLPAGVEREALPSDVVPGYSRRPGSTLHYAPTGPVIRERFARLLEVAQRAQPDAVVVDVSVEAALFLRLAGYPVIHRRMHGDRTDPAHELVYAEVDHLIAHYGAELEDPVWRDRFGDRTTFLGAPDTTGRLGSQAGSRFGLSNTLTPAETREVAVVTGTGGGGVRLTDLARAAGQTAGSRWHVYGPVLGAEGSGPLPPNLVLHGWTDDVSARLREAELVVVSAGYSAVADAAASGRPLVLAPEERPFGEQEHFAAAAHRATGVPWCRWTDESADWAAAARTALQDPAAADRLAAAVLVDPAEYRRRWQSAVQYAASG